MAERSVDTAIEPGCDKSPPVHRLTSIRMNDRASQNRRTPGWCGVEPESWKDLPFEVEVLRHSGVALCFPPQSIEAPLLFNSSSFQAPDEFVWVIRGMGSPPARRRELSALSTPAGSTSRRLVSE